MLRLGERTPPNSWVGVVASYEGVIRTKPLFTQDVGLPLVRFIYLPNNAPLFEKQANKWDAAIMTGIAIHEIGHCLGLAPPSNAERFPNMYATWDAAAPPQLADYVPSNGSHWIEEHPSNLSEYGVWTNSIMGSRLTWWQQYLLGHVDSPYPPDLSEWVNGSITTLDAAALADFGYTVDMSAARPLLVVIKDPKTVPREQPRDYPPYPYGSGKAVVPHWHQHLADDLNGHGAGHH